jgi:hypothetical protein
MRRLRFSFEILLVSIVIAFHLYAAFAPANSLMNWFTTDDAFYYFKTAQNITEGKGVTFDGIAPSNGFHPLWMLVCIPIFTLARFDLILPLRLVILVMGILQAATAVVLYRLGAKTISREVGVLVALAWAFLPRIHSVTALSGLETGVNAFFLALLIYRCVVYASENKDAGENYARILGLGFLAVLALFSRLDNIFIIGTIGIWLVLRNTSIRRFVFFDLLLVICAVFISYFSRLGYGDVFYQYAVSAYWMVGLAVIINLIMLYLLGLYRPQGLYSLKDELLRVFLALTFSAILVSVLMFVLDAIGVFNGFPRAALILDWLTSLALVSGLRLLGRWLAQGDAKTTSLAFGDSDWRKRGITWLKAGATYFIPILVCLGLYMLWNKSYFGTPMPVSGQVKVWWGTMLHTVYGQRVSTFANFLGLNPDPERGGWYFATSIFQDIAKTILNPARGDENAALWVQRLMAILEWSTAALIFVIIKSRWQNVKQMVSETAWIPLFAGCALQILYYQAQGYLAMNPWYWVAEIMTIVLFAAILLKSVLERLKNISSLPRFVQASTVLIGMALLVNFGVMLAVLVPPTVVPENETAYLGGVESLEKYTELQSIIGSTGGGSLAYFIQGRTIVNLDGLINGYEYFQALKDFKANEYLKRIGMDYVYANSHVLLDSEPYVGFFKDHLIKLGNYGGSTLYRYQP